MTDDIRVPIKAWLRGSTFRVLVKVAEQRHTTVGQVLVLLAEQATGENQPTRRKPHTRMTPDLLERMIALRKDGRTLAEISAITGVSRSGVHAHLSKAAGGA